MRKGVDQDRRFISILKRVRKIQPSYTKVRDSHRGRQVTPGKLVRYFNATAIIAHKNVADAADQNAGHRQGVLLVPLILYERLDFRQIKEEAVSWLPQ